MEEVSSPEVEADLERLEADLRRLKREYDMFFAGAIPRQPLELRAQFERMIKRYTTAPIRRFSLRFHFNALVSRYNSLAEHWTRTLRTLEEGERPAPPSHDLSEPTERTVATCRLQHPGVDESALSGLYRRFVEAHRLDGEGQPCCVAFDTFFRAVSAQVRHLQEKSNCHEVELRVVVKNRKVLLKARPGRKTRPGSPRGSP